MVLIGGANALSEDDAGTVRAVLDRAVLPVALDAGAVIVSGGTDAGVMRLLGDVARGWPGVELLGVAPRRTVRHAKERVAPDEDRTSLQPGHHAFVLTAGEAWGSETDVLLSLAKALTAGRHQGLVLLANGGGISRSEASFFMAAGWPVLTLAGTGRAADDLATAVGRRGSRYTRWLQVLGFRRRYADAWEGLESADVEVHDLRRDSSELLARRIRWRLSDDMTTRTAWARYGAFDVAALAEQKWTRRFQGVLAVGALLLAILAVVYGTSQRFEGLKWVLLALPLALAVGSTLADTLVPTRNWLALRQGAEAVQHAIYRRHAALLSGEELADRTLMAKLASIDQEMLRSGVPLGVVSEPTSRPQSLPVPFDEFAELTRTAYLTDRVGGQLRYYRRTAQNLRRRELLAVGTSAVLAGAATAVASEAFAAVWIPILILAASTIVILRQRARWQDKVNLCGAAVADLESVRSEARLLEGDGVVELADVIKRCEDILERETAEWHRVMGRSLLEAAQYQQPLVNGVQ